MATFFVRVHPYQANAFLHRDTTLQALTSGNMSQAVLLGIWAVAARFIDPPEPANTASQWAEEASRRVMSSLDASRETVTTALLLSIYTQHAERITQSHMWCAIANRQALNLGLHQEKNAQTQSWVQAEGDRRLYHACYALERLFSNGTPESIYCPDERIKLRLPCDGFNYRFGVPTETPQAILEGDESSVPPWMYKDVGPMGVYVRLMGARFMIKRCLLEMKETRGIVFKPGCAPWESTSPFAACMRKLADIKNSLPERLRLSSEVVRQGAPGLPPLVMIYVWWNECHVELCRHTLPGYPESINEELFTLAPEGWLEDTRRSCLRHAEAVTSLFDLVSQNLQGPPMVIYDHTLPHTVYSSIRVQVEFAESRSIDDAERERLRSSFVMMMEYVSRMESYFRPAQLLVSPSYGAALILQLKATRRMLILHGLAAPSELPIES